MNIPYTIRQTSTDNAHSAISSKSKDKQIDWFVYHPSVSISSYLLKKHPEFINEYSWIKTTSVSDRDMSISFDNTGIPHQIDTANKQIEVYFQASQALYDACINNDEEKVKFLLEKGANPNQVGNWIVSKEEKDLITNGKANMVPLEKAKFPLVEALRAYAFFHLNTINIIKMLIKHGADVNISDEVLSLSIHSKDNSLISMLMEKGAKSSEALSAAVAVGMYEIVPVLLNNMECDINLVFNVLQSKIANMLGKFPIWSSSFPEEITEFDYNDDYKLWSDENEINKIKCTGIPQYLLDFLLTNQEAKFPYNPTNTLYSNKQQITFISAIKKVYHVNGVRVVLLNEDEGTNGNNVYGVRNGRIIWRIKDNKSSKWDSKVYVSAERIGDNKLKLKDMNNISVIINTETGEQIK